MGITGLIPFLEKASSRVHLKEIRGSTVAVDTYCLLHKGVFCCAEKLVRGEDTDQYLEYCMRYVNLLLHYDIKPIMVFDGRHLPAKELTERRRRESRQQAKKRAAELLRQGKTEEARTQMKRCVDVTHEMALRLIRICRQRNVDCVVAPYEADAQMAWFNKINYAKYVITEDSDLTLFGARNIIFKLDLAGSGLLVQSDKFHLAMGCNENRYSFEKFRRMCILSGCDYLDSLPGIGLAKACKFILLTEQDNMRIALKKLPQYLNMRNLEVSDEYIENFLKAEATFRHMYIYNPFERKMQRLYELEEFETEERNCVNAGTPLEDAKEALHLALGNLNPFTLKRLDNWHPDRCGDVDQALPKNAKRAKHKSMWRNYYMQEDDDDKLKTKGERGSSVCALFYKKVDFISQTIEQEISNNIKEENDKPEEAEVFSMYKHTISESEEPAGKRRRCDSVTETPTKFLDKFDSPPVSPVATKTRHNPFAKVNNNSNNNDNLTKSPRVCENGSLLRILSPKKSNEEIMRQALKKVSHKRSIFANEEAGVEVKSRFFATNVQKSVTQATRTTTTAPKAVRDLTEEIEEIEKIETRSQRIQENLCHLYDNIAPSPEKPLKKPSESDADVQIDKEFDSGIDLPRSDASDQSPEDADVNCKNPDAIVISDNEESLGRKSIDKPKIKLELATFKVTKATLQPTAATVRRLGLSKPKMSSKSGKELPAVRSNGISGSLKANQPLLTQFGFQKRPSLK